MKNSSFLRLFSALLSVFALILLSCQPLLADDVQSVKESEPPKTERATFEYELDAYYTNIGLYINLTDNPIPDAGEKDEFQIYKELLFSSYVPRFVVLEAAVFPMPNLVVHLKDNSPEFYKNGELIGDVNLIKALTAGFQEPYAFSLFLGNVVTFSSPGEKHERGNFGYMGYLISFSNYHIKDNELIEDRSVELEWKIKGDRKFSTHDLHWSFRVGGKLHSNPDIRDALYVSLRRDRLDFERLDSILANSGFEYTFDMDMKSLTPIRHYFTIDKKWPLEKRKVAFSLAAGFIWEGGRKYTGALSERDPESFQIILRPNITF